MRGYVGVILAAGKGSRLFPLTAEWPKPILPILGKPLVEHQVELMRSVGIRRIIVVIGHLGYKVVRTLGDGSRLGVTIEYVEQTEMLGIAHAVGRLEPRLQQPFLLCLGDIFFTTESLSTMFAELEAGGTKAVLASKVETRPEMIRRNFAILVKDKNVVRRVIEKPRYLEDRLKGCGIYLFRPEIFDAIRRTPRTAMRDEYEITESIQILVDDGHRVVHAPIIEEDWNLTLPEDLIEINLVELQRAGQPNFFVDLGGARDSGSVRDSVLGRGVDVPDSASLYRCVVFDDVVVPAGTRLQHAIVTPSGVVHCAESGRS